MNASTGLESQQYDGRDEVTSTEWDRQYGNKIARNVYNTERTILAAFETTGAGNTVLVVGKETPDGDCHGWFQTARIVLTPAELTELAEQLARMAAKANS